MTIVCEPHSHRIVIVASRAMSSEEGVVQMAPPLANHQEKINTTRAVAEFRGFILHRPEEASIWLGCDSLHATGPKADGKWVVLPARFVFREKPCSLDRAEILHLALVCDHRSRSTACIEAFHQSVTATSYTTTDPAR